MFTCLKFTFTFSYSLEANWLIYLIFILITNKFILIWKYSVCCILWFLWIVIYKILGLFYIFILWLNFLSPMSFLTSVFIAGISLSMIFCRISSFAVIFVIKRPILPCWLTDLRLWTRSLMYGVHFHGVEKFLLEPQQSLLINFSF